MPKTVHLALAMLLAGAGAAQAQTTGLLGEYTRGRNVSVTERARPEYDAVGVPLGAFRLYPSVTSEFEYTDNVYATDTNTVADGLIRLTPGFSLSSDWSRNALGLSAQVSRDFHFDIGSEDSTTYSVQGTGRYDVTPNISATALVAHALATEARESSTAAASALDPSQYTTDTAQLSVVDQIDRLRLQGVFTYLKQNYENLTDFAGGTIFNNLRDDEIFTYSARADFAITPDTALFASVTYNDRVFGQNGPLGSLDSNGYQVLAGANFDVTNLIRGEIGVGYLDQSSARGGDAGGFATAARLLYFPTQLTTFTLTANRSFVDSTIVGSPGDVQTSLSGRVDHELFRNLLLFARLGFSREDYTGIDRSDDRYSGSFGASWLVNRLFSVNASYAHDSQSSNGGFLGYSYDSNYVYLGVTLQR